MSIEKVEVRKAELEAIIDRLQISNIIAEDIYLEHKEIHEYLFKSKEPLGEDCKERPEDYFGRVTYELDLLGETLSMIQTKTKRFVSLIDRGPKNIEDSRPE